MAFNPRPNQSEVLAYRGGRLGISAVPGSGKTWTLSNLAARLIAAGGLEDDQEVLIVTLTNSAVDNFSQRIQGFLKSGEFGARLLLPAYRVRTLHGLSNDIVRERPGLLGLSESFQIIDERLADEIRRDAAQAWLRAHPGQLDDLLDPALDLSQAAKAHQDLPDLVAGLALSFIRTAKDMRLSPAQIKTRLEALPAPLPLAEMGAQIYADYQHALNYRGAVDFDDLIQLALRALELDPDLLARLRLRWPYILEDEAQDSSRLQEEILKTLSGDGGNWVRVGDPNQAIFETFTTASPYYLRRFLEDPTVVDKDLPNSGRSTLSIIKLANTLIHWTRREHPLPEVRDALAEPFIQPAPPGDAQPNPPDDSQQVRLIRRKYSPEEEITAVADSLVRWLPDHQDWTVAVLAPRNERAQKIIDELRARNLPVHDGLLQVSVATRQAASILRDVFRALADPGSASKLARVYELWQRQQSDPQAGSVYQDRNAERLRKCSQLEDFISPEPGRDWLAALALDERDPLAAQRLEEFRQAVARWQAAVLLPVDQLLLTLAQDLFTEPGDLATAHKLALLLRRAAESHPDWRLPQLTGELEEIADNKRRFIGFSSDDSGFDPDQHKGKVVVATVHKAKGLEWDRVYLVSVNNYDYPAAQSYDRFISEKWFVRDQLNLEAEARAQLELAAGSDRRAWYFSGEATQQARLDYARERLRLLYVGITRARRQLVVTYNTGKNGDQQPALALVALQGLWEQYLAELSGGAAGETSA